VFNSDNLGQFDPRETFLVIEHNTCRAKTYTQHLPVKSPEVLRIGPIVVADLSFTGNRRPDRLTSDKPDKAQSPHVAKTQGGPENPDISALSGEQCLI